VIERQASYRLIVQEKKPLKPRTPHFAAFSVLNIRYSLSSIYS